MQKPRASILQVAGVGLTLTILVAVANSAGLATLHRLYGADFKFDRSLNGEYFHIWFLFPIALLLTCCVLVPILLGVFGEALTMVRGIVPLVVVMNVVVVFLQRGVDARALALQSVCATLAVIGTLLFARLLFSPADTSL